MVWREGKFGVFSKRKFVALDARGRLGVDYGTLIGIVVLRLRKFCEESNVLVEVLHYEWNWPVVYYYYASNYYINTTLHVRGNKFLAYIHGTHPYTQTPRMVTVPTSHQQATDQPGNFLIVRNASEHHRKYPFDVNRR